MPACGRSTPATGFFGFISISSIDWRAALLSCAAMIAILKLKIGMLPTLAGSALAGVLLLAASG